MVWIGTGKSAKLKVKFVWDLLQTTAHLVTWRRPSNRSCAWTSLSSHILKCIAILRPVFFCNYYSSFTLQVWGSVEHQHSSPAHVQVCITLDQHAPVYRHVIYCCVYRSPYFRSARRRAHVVRRRCTYLRLSGPQLLGSRSNHFIPLITNVVNTSTMVCVRVMTRDRV